MPVTNFEEMPVQKPGKNIERRLCHLNQLMTCIIDFIDGPMADPDPPHSHPHEQISYVASGELFVFIGEEKFHLKEGDVLVLGEESAKQAKKGRFRFRFL